MTRNRIIYAILWVLSLIGISFFGGPVSYGFFTLLTLIPIVSFIYLLFVFFSFRIYQELENKNLTAGHTTPFTFILKNEFPFGFSGIRVKFFSDFSEITGLDDNAEYELQPKTGIKKQTKIHCRYRGEYEVGIKSMELQDYLQLIRLKFNNKETLRVTVKPGIVKIPALKSVHSSVIMTKESSFAKTQADVLSRPYVTGDDIRYANWKVSAKNGDLFIRQMTGEERNGIGIIVPLNRYSDNATEYLPVENKMLETAIALSYFFLKNNTPVQSYFDCGNSSGNAAGGTTGRAGGKMTEFSASKKEQFRDMYEFFSSAEFKQDSGEEKTAKTAVCGSGLFGCKMVFIVVSKLSDSVLHTVRILHENGIPVIIYRIEQNKNSGKELSDKGSTVHGENTGKDSVNEGKIAGEIGLSNVELIDIDSEADLREVL